MLMSLSSTESVPPTCCLIDIVKKPRPLATQAYMLIMSTSVRFIVFILSLFLEH